MIDITTKKYKFILIYNKHSRFIRVLIKEPNYVPEKFDPADFTVISWEGLMCIPTVFDKMKYIGLDSFNRDLYYKLKYNSSSDEFSHEFIVRSSKLSNSSVAMSKTGDIYSWVDIVNRTPALNHYYQKFTQFIKDDGNDVIKLKNLTNGVVS